MMRITWEVVDYLAHDGALQCFVGCVLPHDGHLFEAEAFDPDLSFPHAPHLTVPQFGHWTQLFPIPQCGHFAISLDFLSCLLLVLYISSWWSGRLKYQHFEICRTQNNDLKIVFVFFSEKQNKKFQTKNFEGKKFSSNWKFLGKIFSEKKNQFW